MREDGSLSGLRFLPGLPAGKGAQPPDDRTLRAADAPGAGGLGLAALAKLGDPIQFIVGE